MVCAGLYRLASRTAAIAAAITAAMIVSVRYGSPNTYAAIVAETPTKHVLTNTDDSVLLCFSIKSPRGFRPPSTSCRELALPSGCSNYELERSLPILPRSPLEPLSLFTYASVPRGSGRTLYRLTANRQSAQIRPCCTGGTGPACMPGHCAQISQLLDQQLHHFMRGLFGVSAFQSRAEFLLTRTRLCPSRLSPWLPH